MEPFTRVQGLCASLVPNVRIYDEGERTVSPVEHLL